MMRHKKYGKAKFNSIRLSGRYFGRYRIYNGAKPDDFGLLQAISNEKPKEFTKEAFDALPWQEIGA